MTAGPQDDELVTIRIEQLPVPLQNAAQQHADELTRELMLVAESVHQQGDAGNLPRRFIELVGALTEQYSMFTGEQEQQLQDAAAQGRPSIDLVYRLPGSVAGAAATLGEILDEVDAYCREGKLLLTLETPPPLVDFRRWFLDQFVDQAAGEPPVPWPAYQPAAGSGSVA
jgi:hypothetical protein